MRAADISLDLSRAAVFVDFDGTITPTDTGVHILERLAPDEWRAIEAEYARGAIGSRECLVREWALVAGGLEAARAAVRELRVDPAFEPLVRGLRAAGAEVTVVSDGFGFYAEEVCARVGVECLTNFVDPATNELEFPNLDRCCACSACGTCKQAPIKDAKRRGRTTVFVGDGVSDRKAVLLADIVFAKEPLASWCEDMEVPYSRFEDLGDVSAALLPQI